MENKGIDYGNGLTNTNIETGIRFGVIPHNAIGSAWYEESEAEYGDPTCPKCACAPDNYDEDIHGEYEIDEYHDTEFACQFCEYAFDSEQAYPEEPLSFWYNSDGYAMEQTDEVDVFVFNSPYYTFASFCSPCAPGACYLLNPIDEQDDNNKCYCLGHDWFEREKAPYPVYSVETGKLV